MKQPLRPILAVTFALMLSTAAFAERSHERTQFGRDITVQSGETVDEVTCFGCTARIRGRVTGDVTVLGGNVVVEDEGEIAKDTTVFAGSLHLASGAQIGGDVTVFGGELRREADATIKGDVTNFGGPVGMLIILLPFAFLSAFIYLVYWLVRRLVRPGQAVPVY